jgi:AraC family transcriptional activator of mtrCDE
VSQVDWLSHLMKMITITGQVEVRCAYGAPWRVTWAQSAAHEIPYRVVLRGRAIIENPEMETAKRVIFQVIRRRISQRVTEDWHSNLDR